MISPRISVITPVYNVRPFIEKCVVSLMRQTFTDVEFIFVDDASSDGSIDILKEIISQYKERNVRIIHHETNMGLPASRKTGFEAATGEYVFNCDGDDWVEESLLEDMYSAVSRNNYDYAYCDFYLTYSESERYMHCPTYRTPDDALRLGYLSGAMKYNVWNKLIRRSLYKDVIFPIEHRKGGEDLIMLGILSRAKSVIHVPKALYHYVKTNGSAISESFSKQRLIDVRYNADSAINVLLSSYEGNLDKEIAYFKLNIKLQFIISKDQEKYDVWKAWYPESNPYILSNKQVSLRIRLVEWCAAHGLWFFVRAHYFIFYTVLYSLMYK